MTLQQKLMAIKIEYHWWRIGMLRRNRKNVSEARKVKSIASENLHRYEAEKTLIQYEIAVGLRDAFGYWK